ncbi:MAG: hypothetical protein H6736_04220 [Alphaproteobacteria bacterium]|nr:hypothetical protein [Alphaproteobacteria bacterium]MCB9691000.1 hypothetical protein [Alphaproteobacteria bacterium]
MSDFCPPIPRTLADTGVPPALLDGLLLKALYEVEGASATALAQRLAMPLQVVMDALSELKIRKLVVHRGAGLVAGDYTHVLTEEGMGRADLLRRRSGWSHAAPVPWEAWLQAVEAQTLRGRSVGPADILRAVHDLELPRDLVRRLGMALATGRTLFLYGQPGNGKTSIAERITGAFDGYVFVPRLLLVDGQLVRVFDAKVHTPWKGEVPPHDPRWVCCERPTVIAGGELRMEMLELTLNEHLGLAEAPLQLKAAGGTLVIDDLGRQVMPPATLLNRWIVPLDRGVDHLTLPDGTPLVVPFDPFVVFSTNLDPKDLADEAFLRRIPYKLAVDDPDPDTFAELLTLEARRLKLKFEDGVEDGILAWFADSGTPMRACHPRDILRQVEARQRFLGREPVVSQTAITDVLRSYFVA